jgi:transposase-like protein
MEARHMMTQNATDPAEGRPLSPQQIRIIERLLAGETVTGAAREVGVSRETIHRWLRANWTFQATLNRGQREIQNALQARVLTLASRALDTVSQALERGEARVAMDFLMGSDDVPNKLQNTHRFLIGKNKHSFQSLSRIEAIAKRNRWPEGCRILYG